MKISLFNVIEELADLFIIRGSPDHNRSDNGPESVSKAIRGWLERLGVKTLFIEPGSPWENSYIEPFNGKFRDELLKGDIFDTITEARIFSEQRRNEHN